MENFAWTFQSRFEKSKHWYVVAATLIITGIIVSFLVGEYLLGIVLIVFTGVYLLYDINTHPEVRVQINSDGIILNQEKFDYTRIRSFGIIRVDSIPMILRFKTNNKTIREIDLFIDPAINLESLRNSLQEKIPEDAETDVTAIERLLLGLRL